MTFFPTNFPGYPDTDFSLKSSKGGVILGKNDTGYKFRYTYRIKTSKFVLNKAYLSWVGIIYWNILRLALCDIQKLPHQMPVSNTIVIPELL